MQITKVVQEMLVIQNKMADISWTGSMWGQLFCEIIDLVIVVELQMLAI